MKRTYESTHPWITFQLDLRRSDHSFWLLLGEAKALCDDLIGVPLQPSEAKRLYNLFLAKGAQATTAIEGNTLSENEVLLRIEGLRNLPPSKEYLGQEIDNIVAACNQIAARIVQDPNEALSAEMLAQFNETVLRELPVGAEVVPGKVRDHSVVVANYRGAPANECSFLLDRMCEWLNSEVGTAGFDPIVRGIMKAILAHLYIEWIHPFGDGNGRVGRLVEFQILLSAGVPDLAAHLLSNHYNMTRADYYRQLAHASDSGGHVFPFMKYALQGFIDGLKEQMGLIREQQFRVHWKDYMYTLFGGHHTETADRRRRLAMAIYDARKPVALEQIRRLTPELAESYSKKAKRTISRDVNKLAEMHLIRGADGGIVANRALIAAFVTKCLSESTS